jgi:prepilin-type N-terminal cleavage/methylation domain-containing protein
MAALGQKAATQAKGSAEDQEGSGDGFRLRKIKKLNKTTKILALTLQPSDMKDLSTLNKPAHQRGTTLIELSVVIAVLLLLVGVLFIGITAWKNGANTAACVVNLSGIQKAVRGYQNLNGLLSGATLTVDTLTTAGYWSTAPVCPAGGVYTPLGTIPAQGVPYMTCSLSGHAPSGATLANW